MEASFWLACNTGPCQSEATLKNTSYRRNNKTIQEAKLSTHLAWWCHEYKKIFHVTGLLCGEFTTHQWIPLTKASDMELRCFLWSAAEQMAEQTTETPEISNTIALFVM